jgi:CBS domain-containing protein
VYTITENGLLHDAMLQMAEHMVGALPVVNEQNHLLGIILLDDILTLFMPHFVEMLRSADFIHDYSFLEHGRNKPQLVKKAVTELMRKPYFIQYNGQLMEAMVLMHKHGVEELPVLNDDNCVIGIVSRGRVGSLFLTDWLNHLKQEA